MAKSAVGIWISRSGGFTLLEVMVTLVLIGIIASFAVLSLSGGGESQPLIEEARRLQALVQLSREEALLLNEQRGIQFTATEYRFVSFDPDSRQWAAPRESGLLQNRRLPPGMQLQLAVEGRPVNFDQVPADRPQVLLLSSGETTEFAVLFRLEDSRNKGYVLAGDPTGQLRLEAVR